MTTVAVGFDFDHTLGIDNGLELHAFARLAERFGVRIDVAEASTRAALEVLLVRFRAGEEPLAAMLARFIATLPPNAELRERGAESFAASYRQICYDLVDELVRPLDGAVECIAALVAGGTPVGILTNGWSELQERKIARALGAFPGPVLVSELIGAYKPSADAFGKLEAALGVGPADLWYVGDNPAADVAGARAYGLRAVWLNADGAAYPADLAPPTAEIEHLSALPAIIRGA